MVDKVWLQGKDAAGNRRTYSLLVDRSLAAAAALVAHAQGTLTTTAGPMAANARVVSTALGALTTAIRLAGGPLAQAHAAASLVGAVQLAAGPQQKVWLQVVDAAGNRSTVSRVVTRIGAAANSTASASLTTSPRLAASGVDVAHASAGLINWATVTLAPPLYTGSGSILDSRYWEGTPPAVGDRIAYDSTYLTILPSGEMEWTSNSATALAQYNNGSGWQMGSVTVLPTEFVAFAGSKASATGTLAGASSAALSTQALVVASAAAALAASILLNGSAAGQTQVLATLSALVKLQADSGSRAQATGSLNAQPGLAAVASSEADATGELWTQIRMAGAAVINAAVSADLLGGLQLSGFATSTVLSSGALEVGIGLSGDAAAVAQAEADLMARIQLIVEAQATATVQAQMTALGPVVIAPRGEPNYGRSRRPRVH